MIRLIKKAYNIHMYMLKLITFYSLNSKIVIMILVRPGDAVNISITVGHAENFPVDLYFLMDLSWSMRTSRNLET